MKAIFDTSILLDQLHAVAGASEALLQYDGVISSITAVEILSGAKSAEAKDKARELLSIFEIIHTNDNISEQAAEIRRDKHLSASDAIIYATAKHLNYLLVTSNFRDFNDSWKDVKIPYKV